MKYTVEVKLTDIADCREKLIFYVIRIFLLLSKFRYDTCKLTILSIESEYSPHLYREVVSL